MASKGYRLPCPLATALDLLGDRWTLLIIRDLLGGPARFADLERGLPGVSPSVLTRRLRELLDAGIVVRRQTEHQLTVYELTELGERIRGPIDTLGGIGLAIGVPAADQVARPDSLRGFAPSLRALLDIAGHDGPATTIGLEVDGEWFTIVLAESGTSVTYRRPPDPDGVVTTSFEVISGLINYWAPGDTLRKHADGDRDMIERLASAFEASR